jgi:outer membrane biosynthesis protein TonB
VKRSRPTVQGGGAVAAVGTLTVHGAVIAFAFMGTRPPRPGPPVYAVELVAAPAPIAAPEAPVATAPAASTPEAAVPTAPQPKPVVRDNRPAAPKPEPVRTPPKPTPTPPNPGAQTARTATTAAVTPAQGETPSNGTDAVTVKTPGLSFPYPDYLRNIVSQVYRRWERPRGGTRRAEVFFMILRDGSVRDIRFLTPSGDFTFDLNAQGAVEQAANDGAFGALPDGYPQDVLPVSFYFEPGRTP